MRGQKRGTRECASRREEQKWEDVSCKRSEALKSNLTVWSYGEVSFDVRWVNFELGVGASIGLSPKFETARRAKGNSKVGAETSAACDVSNPTFDVSTSRYSFVS